MARTLTAPFAPLATTAFAGRLKTKYIQGDQHVRSLLTFDPTDFKFCPAVDEGTGVETDKGTGAKERFAADTLTNMQTVHVPQFYDPGYVPMCADGKTRLSLEAYLRGLGSEHPAYDNKFSEPKKLWAKEFGGDEGNMDQLLVSAKLFVQDKVACGDPTPVEDIFALHVYTMQCSIFVQSNACMRMLHAGGIKLWRPFIYYCTEVRANSKYRGVHDPQSRHACTILPRVHHPHAGLTCHVAAPTADATMSAPSPPVLLFQALKGQGSQRTVVFRGLYFKTGTEADRSSTGKGVVADFLDGVWPNFKPKADAKPDSEEEAARKRSVVANSKYQVGSAVLWPAFSSTTENPAIALGYGTSELDAHPEHAAVILKIFATRACPIRNYSYYPFEEELLYSPNTCFRVKALMEPTAYNLRKGTSGERSEAFFINTDHLSSSTLELDEARMKHTLLIEMHEEPLPHDHVTRRFPE